VGFAFWRCWNGAFGSLVWAEGGAAKDGGLCLVFLFCCVGKVIALFVVGAFARWYVVGFIGR